METGLEWHLISSPEQFVCWWICHGISVLTYLQLSRADILTICRHSIHGRTHTHILTFAKSQHILSSHFLFFWFCNCFACVFTSSSYRYEVTLCTATVLSVQTCWGYDKYSSFTSTREIQMRQFSRPQGR